MITETMITETTMTGVCRGTTTTTTTTWRGYSRHATHMIVMDRRGNKNPRKITLKKGGEFVVEIHCFIKFID